MHSTRWCAPPRPLGARDRRAMELGIFTEEVEMQVRDLRKSVGDPRFELRTSAV